MIESGNAENLSQRVSHGGHDKAAPTARQKQQQATNSRKAA